MPLTMAAFTAAALSMTGIPPTLGFVSKWHIGLGAVEAGYWAVVPVILGGSLLTGIYFWRVIEPAYFGAPPQAGHKNGEGGAPRWALAPALALAALGTALGLAAQTPAVGAARAAAELLGR
jgi:multicomponent Na+:H+ antiporter subunit D